MAVYLLHFDKPISNLHTCQHYLGFAKILGKRIERHQKGFAARLTEVALERNIKFTLVRSWSDGTKWFERKLKNAKNSPRYCPICNPKMKRKGLRRGRYGQLTGKM